MKFLKSTKLLLLIGLITFLVSGPLTSQAGYAQSPADWQSLSDGLATQTDPEKKTAGLSLIVQAQDWPFLSLPGGVAADTTILPLRLYGPVGIQLGQVSIPGASGGFVSESTDWSHNELAFGSGSQLKMWVSRLSAASLVQTSANSLRYFSGNVSGYTTDGSTVTTRAPAPAFPKYAAIPTSNGSISVKNLSTAELNLSDFYGNWMLVWYGANSHFIDTKIPVSYKNLPVSKAYQADAPMLLIFQNTPTSIRHSASGGIELTFPGPVGSSVVMPLFGRELLKASHTEGWANGFPADVSQKARWWADRLCSFPVSAAESYTYYPGSDRAEITESITYLTVCPGGVLFAPIPPMLSVAREVLPIQFSHTLVNGNLPTEFGPSLGIEQVSEYSYSISGLKKYTDGKRITLSSAVPPDLEQELAEEVQQIVSAGHLRPWVFMDATPVHTQRGDLYWANPADNIIHLVEIAEALPESSTRQSLLQYIRSERNAYPPESVYDLSLTDGSVRENFSSYWLNWQNVWTTFRSDVHLERVQLYNFYALSRYYDLTGDAVPTAVYDKAALAFDQSMYEQDWATFYWFEGFDDRRVAVVNANRHFAGLTGYINLMKRAGNTSAENLGRALLAKAAVMRVGMAHYPRYLYSAGLVELPEAPNWHNGRIGYIHGNVGYLFNFSWTGPSDDARQVVKINEFTAFPFDTSGFDDWDAGSCSPHFVAYRDMVPELARLMNDFAYDDVKIYAQKAKELFPHWFASFTEAMLGNEHGLNHPIDAFQLFMAESQILDAPPQTLATYLDVPWLEVGDLFFAQKLAETIKQYRGLYWDNSILLYGATGDRQIHLEWETFLEFPAGAFFEITYIGPTGDQPSPVTNIPTSVRSYTLTGLQNYKTYQVQVSVVTESQIISSSNTLKLMPSKYKMFLPSTAKKR